MIVLKKKEWRKNTHTHTHTKKTLPITQSLKQPISTQKIISPKPASSQSAWWRRDLPALFSQSVIYRMKPCPWFCPPLSLPAARIESFSGRMSNLGLAKCWGALVLLWVKQWELPGARGLAMNRGFRAAIIPAASADQDGTNSIPRKKPEDWLPSLAHERKHSNRAKIWEVRN